MHVVIRVFVVPVSVLLLCVCFFFCLFVRGLSACDRACVCVYVCECASSVCAFCLSLCFVLVCVLFVCVICLFAF